MKKIIALLLVFCMIFACVACSNDVPADMPADDQIQDENNVNNEDDTINNEENDSENNEENNDADANDQQASTKPQKPADKPANKPEDNTQNDTPAVDANATIGQSIVADFKALMASGSKLTTDEIAEKMLQNEKIQFMSGFVPVEAGWLPGFREDITGFSSGTQFGPMMGSIAFVGYIFYIDDASQVANFASNLKSLADPRWNICVTADETFVETSGNYVFFLMSPAQMEG